MSKKLEAVLIIVAWCVVAAISQGPDITLADCYPPSGLIRATDEGSPGGVRLQGREWVHLGVFFGFAALLVWRMARRRPR